MRVRSIALFTFLAMAACDKNAPPQPRTAPRPVEVYVLSEVDPARPMELTGSVSSWKEQDVGFEVGGRVRFVQEPGTGLSGRWEESGQVRVSGQILAELDDQPYRIEVANAESARDVAQERINVTDAELAKVLPATLRAAKATEQQARAEYGMYREAGALKAVSELDVLRRKAAWDVAIANVAKTEALFDTKRAEKRTHEAALGEAREQLNQARWRLDRCRLFAPFSGEISEVLIEAGGYAQPGQPVAHLVMMDPIQVEVAVSADTLRGLQRYADVQLSVPGADRPIRGRIYDLATVADPKTRTFRVSMIVRNERRSTAGAAVEEKGGDARVDRVLVPIHAEPGGPWCVEARRSLRQDDRGWFVWAIDGPARPGDRNLFGRVVAVRKVRVKPAERMVNFQGIYVLRELADAGDLTADTILPLDLPEDFPEGGKVLISESGWMLQPGQIVGVLLAANAPPPGIFLPMNVVIPDGDGDVSGRVFIAEDGKARSVRLDLSDRVGQLVRVRAVEAGEAALVGPGAQVIVQAHFLHEDEPVRVIRTLEVRP